jgi:hypothetical protein
LVRKILASNPFPEELLSWRLRVAASRLERSSAQRKTNQEAQSRDHDSRDHYCQHMLG